MTRLATLLFAVSVVAGMSSARAGESTDYLYRLHCSGCHGIDGTGSKVGRIPPFPGVVGHFADSPQGRLYLVHVPGVANAALPDEVTADLLNYVLHNWGGRAQASEPRPFTREEVGQLRGVRVDDVAVLRQELGAALSRRRISIAY